MKTEHYFADHLYAKAMQVPAGWQVGKHVHSYSHLSILASGSVTVTADGVATVHDAAGGPVCIEIKAGIEHVINAITPAVWFCIHATDEKDISKIDDVLIREI